MSVVTRTIELDSLSPETRRRLISKAESYYRIWTIVDGKYQRKHTRYDVLKKINKADFKVQEAILVLPNSEFTRYRDHGEVIKKYAAPFFAKSGRTIVGYPLKRHTSHSISGLPLWSIIRFWILHRLGKIDDDVRYVWIRIVTKERWA